nr:MAG TPA: hypothetical protein [Caudoviricetes sp.]
MQHYCEAIVRVPPTNHHRSGGAAGPVFCKIIHL